MSYDVFLVDVCRMSWGQGRRKRRNPAGGFWGRLGGRWVVNLGGGWGWREEERFGMYLGGHQ